MREEIGVEVAGVVDKAALARIARAGMVGVGVIQALQIPAAVGGELGDRIGARGDQLPQLLGRVTPRPGSGSSCPRSRSAHRCAHGERLGSSSAALCALHLRAQIPRHRQRASGNRRSAWRAASARCLAQAVSELDRAQRVEAKLLEGALASTASADACPSTAATWLLTSSATIASHSDSGEPASLLASDPCASEALRVGVRMRPSQDRRQHPGLGLGAQGGAVQAHRQEQGLIHGAGEVDELAGPLRLRGDLCPGVQGARVGLA